MAEIQEGIQVLFDHIETSDASSDDTTTDDAENKDFHQAMYPSYVPPHKRGHNIQQDKFVNFKDTPAGELDKIQGIDNNKYQRLHLPVPFALDRNKLTKLKSQFPGLYFSCKDNGNHDHPISHVVTMVGTRFMQRRIKPGSKILDVYGNPNACDRFNSSQIAANNPKFMRALVNRVGPSDFIREVNKWGPFFDENNGVERYHKGSLMSMVNNGQIEQYDVLHMTHTLYYTKFEDLAAALHAPGKRVAYALVHRHVKNDGSINDGEQTYSKKIVGGIKLVRQVNVATQSSYVHPDLSDLLFAERKVWLPRPIMDTRASKGDQSNKGLTWEMHIVNDDTWVVEFVPYIEQEIDGVEDYAAMWDDDEVLMTDDYMTTSTSSVVETIEVHAARVIIPTKDGKFIDLDIPCRALFDKLRVRCSGKARTPKLLEELIATAIHLVDPSSLFGDKDGMQCPPDKIYDVAVAAFTADVPKEILITEGIACLRPVLNEHARNMKLGHGYQDLNTRDLLGLFRTALGAAKVVNKLSRAADPVALGLDHLTDLTN